MLKNILLYFHRALVMKAIRNTKKRHIFIPHSQRIWNWWNCVKNKWIVYIVYHKNNENCGSLALELIFEFFTKLLVFYFVSLFVFPSLLGQILFNLQNFWQFSTADGKSCWKLCSALWAEKLQNKNVKSFAGHPVFICNLDVT